MADKDINPMTKTALELGPVIAFFVAYLWLKDRIFTIGGTEYGGFILVTAGELVLRTDVGEFTQLPGMYMGFEAGDRNAHHLHNRSALPATFIVVGARVPGDLPFYPDDDLAVMPTPKGRIAVHKNARPYGDVPAGD